MFNHIEKAKKLALNGNTVIMVIRKPEEGKDHLYKSHLDLFEF